MSRARYSMIPPVGQRGMSGIKHELVSPIPGECPTNTLRSQDNTLVV